METKFFAIIDSKKEGPFTLPELEAHGVGPDTYVWCKGMQKWRKARHVADVCRYWRQRLAGELPQDDVKVKADPPSDTPDPSGIPLTGMSFRQVRGFNPEDGEPDVNIDVRPKNLLLISLFVTIFCMPLTGFIALYFSSRSNALWMRAESLRDSNAKESEEMRKQSHDSNRSAKMWIGITFFLGLIVQGVLMRYLGGGF